MNSSLRPRSGRSQFRVKSGDCLWNIAGREYGDPRSWKEIARINGLRSPYVIYVGQELRLPVASAPTSSAPKPQAPLPRPASSPQQSAARSHFGLPDAAAMTLAKPVEFPTLELPGHQVEIPFVFAAPSAAGRPRRYVGVAKLSFKFKAQGQGAMERLSVSRESIKIEHGPAARGAMIELVSNFSLDLSELKRSRLVLAPSLALKASTGLGGWELELKGIGSNYVHGSFSQSGQKITFGKHHFEFSVECEVQAFSDDDLRPRFNYNFERVWERVTEDLHIRIPAPKSELLKPFAVVFLGGCLVMSAFAARFSMAAMMMGGVLPGEQISCQQGVCMQKLEL